MKKFTKTCAIAIVVLTSAIFAMQGCEKKETGAASGVLSDIKQKGALIVGTAGNMPPFNMIADDGKVIGYEADLASMFAEFLGVEPRFEIMPFAELLPALKKGDVHMVMSAMTITPERNVDVAFVGPYYVSSKALLTREKSVATGTGMKRFNDPRFKFTALKGSTSQQFVEKNFPDAQLVPAAGYPEAVEMTIRGEVHAMLADYPICAVSMVRYPDAGFYTDLVKLTYEPLGIAIPSNDPHMSNWLENTLNLIKGDGTLAAVEERWFNDLSWLSKLP